MITAGSLCTLVKGSRDRAEVAVLVVHPNRCPALWLSLLRVQSTNVEITISSDHNIDLDHIIEID